MHKKGNLFHLIKSLSPTEKRYFRRFCTLHQSNPNYLKLFDELERQIFFDEGKVRKKFIAEAFTNQLHVTKNYLYHLILKSLRNYHSKISKDAVVKDLLRDAEILLTRELFDQCHYVLEKAEKIAQEYEIFPALVQVYELTRRLANAKYGPDHESFRQAIRKMDVAIQQLADLNRYWQLTANLPNSLLGQGVPSDGEENLTEQPQIDSLQGKILHHHILFGRGLMRNNSMQAESHIDALITLLESNPHRIKNEPVLYTNSLSNKVGFLLFSRRWEEAVPLLTRMRNVPKDYGIAKDSKFSVRTIIRSYNLELELYRDRKEVANGLKLVEEVEVFLSKYEKAIPEDYFLLIWNQFANLYFLAEAYSNALKWVNRILDNKVYQRADLTSYARILHLMIHFELGNIVFIKYAVESHKRYLKKQKLSAPFLQCCIKFFTRITSVPKGNYSDEFQRFHHELFHPEHPLADESTLDYVDVKTWIEQYLS